MEARPEHRDTDPIDMRDPAFRTDPHPLLRGLRERGGITRDVVGTWLVTRHADASAGLRSRQLSREFWRLPLYREHRPYLADSTLERTTERWMLFADPPAHTRLRGLVADAFRPRVVDAMRARIEAITDELLDGVCRRMTVPGGPDPEFDLMAELAQPLPVRVICDLMGLPFADFGQTKLWVDALAMLLEPVSRREQRLACNRAAEAMVAYLRAQIAARRAGAPRDDVLGLLLAAQSERPVSGEETLSDDELMGNLILLFIAGHETTTNLIGNGMLTLLRHPDQLARLRADPTLAAGAVEEVLRFEGSVAMISRFTVEPYRLGPASIPAGQTVMFLFSPINRDPTVFREPETFDIGRHPNPHLSFGAGIHFCLGARLARLEGEIAFTRLLRRFESLRLADPVPRWRALINLRGLETLRLRAPRRTPDPRESYWTPT